MNYQEARLRGGYKSQEALARKVGCSVNNYNSIENYKSFPRIELFDKICIACGCRRDDIDIFLPNHTKIICKKTLSKTKPRVCKHTKKSHSTKQ